MKYTIYEATGQDGRKYIGCKGWVEFSEFEAYETSCTDKTWLYKSKEPIKTFDDQQEAALYEQSLIKSLPNDGSYANNIRSANLLYKAGEQHPWYNRNHIDESKLKMSKKRKGLLAGEKHPLFGKKGEEHPAYGYRHTNEAKQKISESRKGNKLSEEAKRKVGEASRLRNSGSAHPNYDKRIHWLFHEKSGYSLFGQRAYLIAMASHLDMKITYRGIKGLLAGQKKHFGWVLTSGESKSIIDI